MPTSSAPGFRALVAASLLTAVLVLPAPPSLAGGLDAILGEGGGGQSTLPGAGLPGLPVGPVSPIACSPNGAGSPCGLASGPASQPASGTGQNVGAGNPINVLSGNKYQVEVDLPPLPGVLGLEIVRHYNSQYARPNVPAGILGRGWKLSYETDLYVVAKTLQIVQADGTRILFSRDPQHPDLCATDDPARGQIRIQTKPQGDDYVWVWPDGRRLFFNHAGKLTQIVAPTGEFVTLTRDPAGMLLKVTDPQGRSLVLSYADRRDPAHFHGVRVIDSPVGRFAYAYGSTLPAGADAALATLAKTTLVRVTLPAQYDAGQKAHPFANRGTTESAVTRAYHYESAQHPTLLTGISVTGTGSDGVPMQQRLSTWAYDDQARAILSVKGALPAATPTASTTSITASPSAATTNPPLRGLEQVNLDFSTQGRTILTNSLGQQTTYRSAVIAGEYRLLEALGPGCATCGPTNVRYRYDARGRLLATTTLDARGQPLAATQVTIDAYSRPLQETRYTFVKGKPVAQGWVRYDYAPGPAAAHSAHSAAKPNAATDPDTVNLPDPKPTRITRPSVVPGKVHEWRLTYNAAGQVLTVIENGFAPALPGAAASTSVAEPTPISRTTTYAYQVINGRSLLKSIDGPLPNGAKGDPSDSDVTQIAFDARGDYPVAETAPGGWVTTFEHDAAGRVTTRSLRDGFRQRDTQTVYAGLAPLALQPVSISRTGWRRGGVDGAAAGLGGQRA